MLPLCLGVPWRHLPIGLQNQNSPLLPHLQIHTMLVCFSSTYILVGFCSITAAPRSYDNINRNNKD